MAALELGSTGLFNDPSIQSYYKLENVNDSKASNTLTNNGTVTFAAAKFNNGADFGSANSTKSLTSASKLGWDGSAYSYSFWVKLSAEITADSWTFCELSDNTTNTVFQIQYQYNAGTIRLRFARIKFGTAANSVTINGALGTSSWYHLVMTYDGSTMRAYINNVEVGNVASSGDGSVDCADGFSLGVDAQGNLQYTSGIIDDWVGFTRALTTGEINTLYLGGIAFDVASNSTYQASASTYNWSHTTYASGNSRYLIVGVSMLSVAGSSVTGITYNSVAMTFLGAVASVSGAVRSELWGLVAPSTGANSIAVTLSTGLVSAACAITFTGVHQTSPTEGFASATATNVGAADATVNVVTVADNDWVVDQVATDDTAITVGAGQTSRNNVTGAGGSGADSTEPDTTPSTVTMSWTNVAGLATWSIVAIALRDINAATLASGGVGWGYANTGYW